MKLEALLQDEKPIPMGDGNLYHIIINDTTTVHLRSFTQERFFYLYGKIAELTEGKGREQLLERLMEAHLFGQESGDAHFAFHQKTNTLLLMATFDSEVATYQQLQERLHLFVEFLEYWRKELKKTTSYKKENHLKEISQKKKKVFFI